MILSEETKQDIMNRVEKIVEGSYTDKDGYTQHTLDLGIDNGLDGRNIQQELADERARIQAEREAKKSKPKNPNRVEGGRKACATRKANKEKEFYNRPIFQALGLTADNNSLNEETIRNMISLIEGELINFNNKKNEKILVTNAKELNRMFDSGELDNIRYTSNGHIMGDPVVVKKLKEMNLQSNRAAKELEASTPKKDNVVQFKKDDSVKEGNEIMEELYIEDLLEAVSESMMEQYGYIDEGVLDAIKKGAKKVAGLFKKKRSAHDVAREILNKRKEKREEKNEKGQHLIGTSKKEPLLLTTSKKRRGRPKGSKNKTKLEPAVQAAKETSAVAKETPAKPASKKRGRPLGSKNKERINGKEVIHKDRYPSKDKAAGKVVEVNPENIKEPMKSETTKVTKKVGRPKKVKETVTILHDKDKAKGPGRAKNGRVSVGQISTAGSNVYSKRKNDYEVAKANGASSKELSRLSNRVVQAGSARVLPKTKQAAVQYRDNVAKNYLKYEKKASKLSDKNNKFSSNYEYNPTTRAQYLDAVNKRNHSIRKLHAFTPVGTVDKYAKRVVDNNSLSETTKNDIMNMVEAYLGE